MRIMFMGTPDFATIALKGLCDNGYTPSCVVTKVDKPARRGYKLTASPVKVYALENNIPIWYSVSGLNKLKYFISILKYFFVYFIYI